jgi:hypothetical protein
MHGQQRSSNAYMTTFSTWRKSTSTGVDRPKIPTLTRRRDFSAFTSSTITVNDSNGSFDDLHIIALGENSASA